MNLEQQVCSLELAKKLKELGVKQDSIFDWVFGFDANKGKKDYFLWLMSPYNRENLKWPEQYSAFTVAELGEMLPKGHHTYQADNGWYVPPFNSIKNWNTQYPCKTEANARAQMLIHLIENKLIEIP